MDTIMNSDNLKFKQSLQDAIIHNVSSIGRAVCKKNKVNKKIHNIFKTYFKILKTKKIDLQHQVDKFTDQHILNCEKLNKELRSIISKIQIKDVNQPISATHMTTISSNLRTHDMGIVCSVNNNYLISAINAFSHVTDHLSRICNISFRDSHFRCVQYERCIIDVELSHQVISNKSIRFNAYLKNEHNLYQKIDLVHNFDKYYVLNFIPQMSGECQLIITMFISSITKCYTFRFHIFSSMYTKIYSLMPICLCVRTIASYHGNDQYDYAVLLETNKISLCSLNDKSKQICLSLGDEFINTTKMVIKNDKIYIMDSSYLWRLSNTGVTEEKYEIKNIEALVIISQNSIIVLSKNILYKYKLGKCVLRLYLQNWNVLDIKIDSYNNLHIVSKNEPVKVYNLDGIFIKQYGDKIHSIAIDTKNNVIAVIKDSDTSVNSDQDCTTKQKSKIAIYNVIGDKIHEFSVEDNLHFVMITKNMLGAYNGTKLLACQLS